MVLLNRTQRILINIMIKKAIPFYLCVLNTKQLSLWQLKRDYSKHQSAAKI
jgi:hypothetical protein